ncbi:MAG: hypothetical protein KAT68_19435 [Bacteroidales bacterium]|nr:hypothetical protein [Bacteroidales bacterium]
MKKSKIVFIILIPVIIALLFLNIALFPENIPFIPSVLLIVDLSILLVVYNKKYYNVFIFLIPLIIISLILKRFRMPGWPVIITLSSLVSASCFFILAIKSLFQFKDTRFLKWFGFVVSIVLFIDFTGFGFKMMHWPGAGYLIIIGTTLFIISIIVLVFTLPSANYIKWNRFDRKYFYRVIIIPLIFLFVLSAIINAFPETWQKIMSVEYSTTEYWYMQDYELEKKEGLK